ncbi:MAG: hypothetical protein EA357_07955 [Micavibrio sp.]|nr:MAG: hypothetical protein EA357_07955 [Micavibrio sp.]
MFHHNELFDAITHYGAELGYNFPGDKIISAKLASKAEYDFHTQKHFKTPLSKEYNINEIKNSVVVTFFDDKTFEHKYYNLPARFISESLIEYCLRTKIPLPKNSKKKLDLTEFNVCLDIIMGERSGGLKLSAKRDDGKKSEPEQPDTVPEFE